MIGPTNNSGPIGSAVLTLIWYKQRIYIREELVQFPVVFLNKSKSVGLRLLKFADFFYIPKALSLGLKPGSNTNCLSPQVHCMNDCLTKSLFWPTFTCQILIKFSFLESLWHKKTNCTGFAKKNCKFLAKSLSKENFHTFFVFLDYKSGYLKFCKNFCIFEMAWSRAFQKCIILYFLDKFFFANIFTI